MALDSKSLPASPILMGALGFALLSLLILLYLVISTDPALKIQAIKAGQLHQINVMNGEIIGRDRTKKLVPPVAKIQKNNASEEEAHIDAHKTKASPKDESFPHHADAPNVAVSDEKPISIIDDVLQETAQAIVQVKAAEDATPFVNQELLEPTEEGALPVIGDDGNKPSEAYAKNVERASDEVPIAVLVVDIGMRETLLDKALAMPQAVGVGVNSYSKEANAQAMKLYASGHELWLGLPMQDADYPASDPGPNGIVLESDQGEQKARLHRTLAAMQGYVGVYSDDKEIVSDDEAQLKPLLHDIVTRGLYFMFGNRDSQASKDGELLADSDMMTVSQYVGRNILMAKDLANRFSLAEQRAQEKSGYLLMVEASPLTLRALEKWLPTLKSRGFALVPPSQLYRMRKEG